MAADSSRRGSSLDDEQIMASNIDVALLVAGLDNDFNLRRIERYLAIAMSSQITPVVVLNKADLADDVDGRLVAVDAIAPGVATVAVSARTGQGLDELRAHLLPGTTAAILGSSGVGKSTLVNALLGEDRQATAEVRDSDSRGRHTTTHRELFELPAGRCWSTRQASGRSRCSVPRRASRPPSTTSPTSPRHAGSAIAATTASRAVPSGPRSTTGPSPRSGWPATRSWNARWPGQHARAIRGHAPSTAERGGSSRRASTNT